MSSSSMSSPPSSSSSTISSFSSSLPSPAIAASRMRRQRRNAISRGAESEWDARAPNTPASPSIPPDDDDDDDDNGSQAASPPPWRDDELVCPLARSSSPSTPPPCALPLIAPTEEQVAEIQAMLARFAFPSPTRKHRRSGQIIDHSGTTTTNGPPGAHRVRIVGLEEEAASDRIEVGALYEPE
ncbi:hypothetical protein BC827DRAFT_1272297 [Russula dissimulans]|nr:hypothetical protein BC827DRAFT_1272297 [Russula dissimulans]